jgi:glycosyltransferase involved in cell wall biosynthesis
MITGISIIICCYNSASRLEKTIQHIALQKEVDFSFEVILVDNNSTDKTSVVAQDLFLKYKIINNKIISETKPGLSFARKAGARAAEGDILIFCDDDNWLEVNYLRNVKFGFEKYSDAAILGAWSDAAFVDGQILPFWFNEIKGSMAVGGKPNSDCLVDEVWGAGMAIRTAIAIEIFIKPSVLSDRKGTSLVAGGDTEICERVRKLGYKIYKLTSLKYTHFISPERLTWDYLTRLNTGFGYSNMQAQYYKYNKSLCRLFFGYGFYTIKAMFNNPKGFIFYAYKSNDKLNSIQFYGIKGAWKYIY